MHTWQESFFNFPCKAFSWDLPYLINQVQPGGVRGVYFLVQVTQASVFEELLAKSVSVHQVEKSVFLADVLSHVLGQGSRQGEKLETMGQVQEIHEVFVVGDFLQIELPRVVSDSPQENMALQKATKSNKGAD